MSTGGLADKLGNKFESRWVAWQLLRVVTGAEATAITLEPVSGGDGFEFGLETPSGAEWHQCKTRSTDAWTIKRLSSAGVLEAFRNKIQSETNVTCKFVTDQAASSLGGLCELARRGTGFDAFKIQLEESKSRQSDFEALLEKWELDADVAWAILQRIEVKVLDTDTIEDLINELASSVFSAPARQVLNELEGLGLEHLTKRIDTDTARRLLRDEAGFPFRDYALNPTVNTRVEEAAEQFLNQMTSVLPDIQIERPVLVSEVMAWYCDDNHSHLLMTGSAGAGKSQLLSDIVREFGAKGIPALPIRLDNYLDCKSMSELGSSILGQPCDPVAVLHSLARHGPKPVLILDQLDAVSEISGRLGALKQLALRLTNLRSGDAPFKIIVSCRSYDLENDIAFGNLSKRKTTRQLNVPLFSWEDDLKLAFESAGFEATRFSSELTRLLETPSNLATFMRLDLEDESAFEVSTAGGLVDLLIRKTDRDLGKHGISWGCSEALGVLVEYMNEHQVLIAPTTLIKSFNRAVDLLQSAGLLIEQGTNVRLSHESYFDQLFASRFATTGRRVRDWLISSEQHLFRRTQVRQILSYLRAENPTNARYLQAIDDALNGDGIRYLVKDSAARWLSGIANPTQMEFEIVSRIDQANYPSLLRRQILSGKSWFPVLVSNGKIQSWLSSKDEQQVSLAVGWTAGAFRDHPEIAFEEVERFWKAAANPLPILQQIFRRAAPGKNAKPLAEFGRRLINDPEVEFQIEESEFAGDFLYWSDDKSGYGAELLALKYQRYMTEKPTCDLFIGNGMQENKTSYLIQQLAKSLPVAFVTAFAPLYAETLGRISRGETGHNGWHAERTWTKSFPEEERWGGLLLKTLRAAQEIEPEMCSRFIESFPVGRSRMDLFFVLSAIGIGGQDCEQAFERCLEQPLLFEADDDGEVWMPAAKAAKSIRAHVSNRVWAKFEEKLFRFRPEHAQARQFIEWSKESEDASYSSRERRYALEKMSMTGLTQWRIMRHIGEDKFTPERSRQIQELNRKFSKVFSVREEKHQGGWVRPPISSEQAAQMSNAAWLSAIRKFDGDRTEFTVSGPIGNANALANVFQKCVAKQPERFVRFFREISEPVHSAYADAMLYGLRESNADIATFEQGILAAWPYQERYFDSALINLLERFPEVCRDERIYTWLLDRALNGDPPDHSNETAEEDLIGSQTLDDLLGRGSRGFFVPGGANRNAAWLILAKVVEAVPDRASAIKATLQARLAEEDCGDVLPGMACAGAAYAEVDKDWVFSFLEAILRKDIRVFANYRSELIFGWLVWQDRQRFRWILDALMGSDVEALIALGWIYYHNMYFAEHGIWYESPDEPVLARRAKAMLIAHRIFKIEPVGPSLQTASSLFRDESADVVKQIFQTGWKTALERGGAFLQLVEAAINAPAFSNHGSLLFYALSDEARSFPELGLKMAHRVLELTESAASSPEGEKLSHAFWGLGKVVFAVCEAYAERGAEHSFALDLVDRFLEAGEYNFGSEAEAFDRR